MKKVLFLSFLIPICVFAESISIPNESTVILHADYPYKSTWMPSEEQAQEALIKALNFIDHPTGVDEWQKTEISKIKKNISSYKVQFVGIESNGNKRIWCNFFNREDFDSWKTDVVFVLDGGWWYWQIEYDLETKSCVNFRSNGYA